MVLRVANGNQQILYINYVAELLKVQRETVP